MWAKQTGFTIVELLVVIVVIAILAAVTVVAYNGITQQANDTVVQNDLRTLATKFSLYEAEKGSYPATASQLNTLKFKVSGAGSYAKTPAAVYNLAVCNPYSTSIKKSAVIAMSASGAIYYMYSGDGFAIKPFSPSDWHNEDTTGALRCQAIDEDLGKSSAETGLNYVYYGYNSLDTSSTWRAWTQGGV